MFLSRFGAWHSARLSSIALLACILLAPLGLVASSAAPVFDATRLLQPTDLNATWLVHAGDDPAFAQRDFNDSSWTPFNPSTSIGAIYGQSKPPIIWYRLHVKVDPWQTGLALDESDIARAFEIYVNGERLIASGSVNPFRSYTIDAHVLGRIPDSVIAAGSVVIAMRVHFTNAEWVNGQDPGYYTSNLLLGQYDTLQRESWLSTLGKNFFNWLDKLFLIGLGCIAIVLYRVQRSQKEYLWIAALGALTALELIGPFLATFRNLPSIWEFSGDLLRLATPYLWTSLFFAFVRQRMGWRWKAFLVFAGLGNAFTALEGTFFTSPLTLQLVSNLPYLILLSLVIPIVLAIHWRRGNREAGILLIPVLLFSLYIYTELTLGAIFRFTPWHQAAIRGFNLIDRFPVGPFSISLNNVSGILSTLSLAFIMLERSITMSRRQAQFEAEFEAAQQVQQVLVPERTSGIPGFIVDSVHLPAQQVGGDFFQVLPTADGGLLVIVGDVAGKGLSAAMLVSVLIGAIRATAEFTTDPAALLANLNDRLVGRAGGGFSTALAALLGADGSVRLANAGHLSPYVDGCELEIPGALPLGIAAGGVYDEMNFELEPGSRITFYSDGVVEAQSRSGELFGFDRARELSVQPAVKIAETARGFGQQDDITVLTIERAAAAVGVA